MIRKFTLLMKSTYCARALAYVCVLAHIGVGLWPGLVMALDTNAQELKTVTLQIRNVKVKAELADTPVLQQRGLMFRQALKENHGMVFVFSKPELYCMWMKNTPLALSVAFIDAQGRIVNIEPMEPLTESSHCAQRPVPYALEMERDWFLKQGVKVGDFVQGLPRFENRPAAVSQ
ncbi:MAG: DUF192 domain-containing protein [Burkholderiaceae bacterium]